MERVGHENKLGSRLRAVDQLDCPEKVGGSVENSGDLLHWRWKGQLPDGARWDC